MDRKPLIRQRTALLIPNKQRKRSPKKTYSKAINPLNLQTKPMSLKNLDWLPSSSSESSISQEFEDNKSCCCMQCSKPNKKVKSLQKRFVVFKTQMSIVSQIRLKERFRTAVYCIIYLILRKRKQRQMNKKKQMIKYKTKVFIDGSPLMTPQQMLQHSVHIQQEQNQQSIQAKIIDQRHKQRQSVKIYLQQKLHEKKKTHELTLPQIHKFTQNSFTSIQPLRFPQDSKSPRCSTQLKIYDTAPHSPYLNNIAHETIIQSSFCKTPRPVTKSISQETLITKQQFHIRKSTVTTLKGLV